MVRGTVPRQPAKSGRHEGVRSVPRGQQSRGASRQPKRDGGTGVLARATARTAKPSPKTNVAKPGALPKGYNPLAPDRITAILAGLDQLYPNVTCALQHRSAWELLVATILSAQCTDVRVNMVTPGLFAKYPTPQHFAAIEPEDLEPDIRSTGFFRNKSKSVVGAARKLIADFHGEVPDEMDKILTLPGVARKTANVVLGSWFHQAAGVVVDTHVHRISRRLELTTADDAGKIEQDLMRVISHERWILFSHQIIHHGRQLCIARKPKCVDCLLEKLCHAGDKTWSTVGMHKAAQ
jgi:endonuclease-3